MRQVCDGETQVQVCLKRASRKRQAEQEVLEKKVTVVKGGKSTNHDLEEPDQWREKIQYNTLACPPWKMGWWQGKKDEREIKGGF